MTEYGLAHGRQNVVSSCSPTNGYQCIGEIYYVHLRQTVRCFEAYNMKWRQRNSRHETVPSADFKSQGHTCQNRAQKVYKISLLLL